MSRYNIYSNQKESGLLQTLEVNVTETEKELFVVTKYLNPQGKTIRIETNTIRK
jgi:hypothetical protein